MTQRVEPGVKASWTYDTQPKGIGKLATASTNNGYQRTQGYDGLGRPSQVAITADAVTPTYTVSTTYDASGHISQVTYPSGFTVNYTYTTLGYASQLKDASSGLVYWQDHARDARLH